MPIYEFECLECGVQFEKLVRKAGATGEVSCPMCESRKIEEKLSAFASVSKGGTSTKSSACAPSGG